MNDNFTTLVLSVAKPWYFFSLKVCPLVKLIFSDTKSTFSKFGFRKYQLYIFDTCKQEMLLQYEPPDRLALSHTWWWCWFKIQEVHLHYIQLNLVKLWVHIHYLKLTRYIYTLLIPDSWHIKHGLRQLLKPTRIYNTIYKKEIEQCDSDIR